MEDAINEAMQNPKKSFLHKLKTIAIEISTIVFAVMLSFWLDGISEHSHQQKEVKSFLLGLKEDLTNDIKEMQEDKKSYSAQGEAFVSITSLKNNGTIKTDSIKKYNQFIFNTTGLIQNSGRYEGFKSSGKLGNIEDNDLQNEITDLYQENFPSLIVSTSYYTQRKELLFQYIYKNLKTNIDGSNNLAAVLSTDEAQNICRSINYTNEITGKYDALIKKSERIIEKINKNYIEK